MLVIPGRVARTSAPSTRPPPPAGYQREVQDWQATSEPADYWYDASKKHVNRYDERQYHDELVDVLEIAALEKELGKQSPGK